MYILVNHYDYSPKGRRFLEEITEEIGKEEEKEDPISSAKITTLPVIT